MKTKLPRKKDIDIEKEEQEPKKAFEEFSIDPAVLLELDELEEDEVTEEVQETIEPPLTDEIQVIDVEERNC